MENTIGTYTDNIVRPMLVCIRPQIVQYNMKKIPNYLRKWIPSAKKLKYLSRNVRNSAAQNSQNEVIKHIIILDVPEDWFYDLDDSLTLW